jgi:hypothetical protein
MAPPLATGVVEEASMMSSFLKTSVNDVWMLLFLLLLVVSCRFRWCYHHGQCPPGFAHNVCLETMMIFTLQRAAWVYISHRFWLPVVRQVNELHASVQRLVGMTPSPAAERATAVPQMMDPQMMQQWLQHQQYLLYQQQHALQQHLAATHHQQQQLLHTHGTGAQPSQPEQAAQPARPRKTAVVETDTTATPPLRRSPRRL